MADTAAAAQALLNELVADRARWLRWGDSCLRAGGSTGIQRINQTQKNDWTGAWIECVQPHHAEMLAQSAVDEGHTSLEPVDPALAHRVDEISAAVTDAMTHMRAGEAWLSGQDFVTVVGEFCCWFTLRDGLLYGGNKWMVSQTERALYASLCEGKSGSVTALSPSLRLQIAKLTDPEVVLARIRAGSAVIGGGLTDSQWALGYRAGNFIVSQSDAGLDREEIVSEEKARKIVTEDRWRRLR